MMLRFYVPRHRHVEISSMDLSTYALSTSISLRNTTLMNDPAASHVILDHSYCSPSRRDNEQTTMHVTPKVASVQYDFTICSNTCVLSLISFRDLTITKPMGLERRHQRVICHSQSHRQLVDHRCHRWVLVSVSFIIGKCYFSILNRLLPNQQDFNRHDRKLDS